MYSLFYSSFIDAAELQQTVYPREVALQMAGPIADTTQETKNTDQTGIEHISSTNSVSIQATDILLGQVYPPIYYAPSPKETNTSQASQIAPDTEDESVQVIDVMLSDLLSSPPVPATDEEITQEPKVLQQKPLELEKEPEKESWIDQNPPPAHAVDILLTPILISKDDRATEGRQAKRISFDPEQNSNDNQQPQILSQMSSGRAHSAESLYEIDLNNPKLNNFSTTHSRALRRRPRPIIVPGMEPRLWRRDHDNKNFILSCCTIL